MSGYDVLETRQAVDAIQSIRGNVVRLAMEAFNVFFDRFFDRHKEFLYLEPV